MILIERKPNVRNKHKWFQLYNSNPDETIELDEKESIQPYLKKLSSKTKVVVTNFQDAFRSHAEFRRVVDCILKRDLSLIFGDMMMPAISREIWESEEAKPYVDIIFALLQLGKSGKSGSNKQGPPNLIEAHRQTIKKMVKEGISTSKIGEKIGFHRNYVYKFVQKNFPHLKRDNRISVGWEILDKSKCEIIDEVKNGTAKYKIIEKYGVSLRIFKEWFGREEIEQFVPKIKFEQEDVKEMIDCGESMDSMRKKFHVSPDTMRDFLKEHFPEYYIGRSKSRNKSAILEKSRDEIIKALASGTTKKYLCQKYGVNFVTFSRFLKKDNIDTRGH